MRGAVWECLAAWSPAATAGPAAAEKLRVRVVEAGCRTLVRVSGRLDRAAAPSLEAALRAARSPWVIVDLRAVEYIETPGLRLLLELTDERSPRSGHLCLVVQPGSRVERTLRLAGLDQRCPLVPTVREVWTGRRAESPRAAGAAGAAPGERSGRS